MSDFNLGILTETAHRPWPMPSGPWVMTQTWSDLLFAHWPIDTDRLRALVPACFEIDACDGQAWIALVPFSMSNVSPRHVPPLPGVSAFPELNVRTYVRVDDKPGVFFFSLDAANLVAVGAARMLFNLPYYSADIAMTMEADGRVDYACRRRSAPAVEFQGWYRPRGNPSAPAPGSLEYFLTERYCLYALDHQARPYRIEIHHPPWALEAADAGISVNRITEPVGITLPPAPTLLHFSKRQDMVCWAPERIG